MRIEPGMTARAIENPAIQGMMACSAGPSRQARGIRDLHEYDILWMNRLLLRGQTALAQAAGVYSSNSFIDTYIP